MRRAAIAVLATAVALAGCSVRRGAGPPAPVAAPVAAQALVSADAARRAALRSLRAWARLAYESPEESHKAKQLLVAARPDRLRLEIFSPFGAVFVLAAADGALAAYDRGAATLYRGAASADNLRRYTQIDVPVAGAVDILLGTPPIDAADPGIISLDDGAIELWRGAADGGARVAWYSPALLPLRYEERDRDGRVVLRAAYDAYTTVDGVPVASGLHIELPPSQQRIDITLSDVEVNPALPDAVFALPTPDGTVVVNLDRGAP
jgi:outer membrane biogenesis lipoprotein LolB